MNIYKVNKINTKKTVEEIHKIKYSSTVMGIPNKYNGKDISISVLGSGLPILGASSEIKSAEIFCDNIENIEDKIGVSAMACSILTSNNQYISGISRGSSLYISKVVKSTGDVEESAVIAGILWTIIKQADIMLFTFPILDINNTIKKSIKKAIDNNILCVAPYHKKSIKLPNLINVTGKSNTIKKWDFKYNEEEDIFTLLYPKGYKFFIENEDGKFTSISGKRASPSWLAGFAACLLNYRIKNSLNVELQSIVDELKKTDINKTFPKTTG